MNKYLKLLSPLIFLFSLFLINAFKAIPNAKLWNNYSVLFVPEQTDDKTVISALKDNGITDYVALSEQFLPVNFSENSVEISMFRINSNDEEYNYHKKRNAYFFDSSNNYRLYYVPSVHKKNLIDTVDYLNNQKIPCGIDSSANFPWLVILVAAVLIIILSFLSKNKLLFILCSTGPLYFLFCNPFYQLAISNILLLLCIFFVTNLWKRQGSFSYLLKKPVILAMFGLSFATSFTCGIRTGFVFLLILLSIISVLIFYGTVQDYFRNKKSFIPVLIKPAKFVSIFAKKTNETMLICVGAALIIIALFFLSFSNTIGSNSAKLVLPSAVGKDSQNLPQFEDYYKWMWNIQTYPYKSLNTQSDEEHVEYSRFTENENGLLEEQNITMDYNQDYKNTVFNDIDNLPFNAIEKVLKTEGNDFKAGYASTSNYNVTFFGIIMMFICLFMLLFIYISIIIKKGLKK